MNTSLPCKPNGVKVHGEQRAAFYTLSLPIERRYGSFREEEFDSLMKAFDLVALARNPRALRA